MLPKSYHRPPLFKLGVVALLVLGGLVLSWWQPPFVSWLLARGREVAGRPWAAVLMVAAMAALLALAMPGSLMVFVLAPLHSPVAATILLTAGGVLGAWGAYVIARWAGREWRAGGRGAAQLLLARRGNFLLQVGLRMLPGFPHSAVNYGAGLSGLPLFPFLAAATLGLAVKWYVYSSAIHTLAAAGIEGRPPGPRTTAPLFLLALLLIAGALLRYLLRHRLK